MRRTLIISPHFPPVNAPDHQRVRMSLPYLHEFGWAATVLAVKPEEVEGATLDPLLESTVPANTEVVRVSAIPAHLTRLVGLGNLALRALPYLWWAGNRLLTRARIEKRPFQLVYFSTTQFPVTILGPIWKRKFGLPYAVDFQDPWLDDYYERTGTLPPGGKAKHGISRRLARSLEPRVMRDVSQVISVSPAYVTTLKSRYPHLDDDQLTVLPFGAAENDFEMLRATKIEQRLFNPADGKQHWVYVGAVGAIMACAIRLLFVALREARRVDTVRWNQVRLHFIGTSYAPSNRSEYTVRPIAVECGIGDLVEEQTDRVPYFEAFQLLLDADALMIIGSDSPAYSASKLYPYMFARKPMLSILHQDSPAAGILRECRAGEIVTFDPGLPQGQSAAQMAQALQRVYTMAKERVVPEVDEQALAQYSAHEMTRKQCVIWDRAIAGMRN